MGQGGTRHPSGFALVLAIWGTRYGAPHVNGVVEAAFRFSPALDEVVLLTDRPRDGIDRRVIQRRFPSPFDEAEFFEFGYRAKLAAFSAVNAEPGKPCVFLDLDTIVIGDLGDIAGLVRRTDDLFMLPPAGLGFSRLRRRIDRIRPGLHFPVGNSSVVAFHSAANPNLATRYSQLRADGQLTEGWSAQIDDILISWFGRDRVLGIPTASAVMLRREFLSRVPFLPALKAALPWVRRRRAHIAAVTMNGVAIKPESLALLPKGAPLADGKGRKGRWNPACFGALWHPLEEACKRIVASSHAKSD
jgi:hypothetical protein